MDVEMIKVGRYRFGIAPVSMIFVFIVLSVGAIVGAVRQYRPECSMPLSTLIIIKASGALMLTLLYGIIVHFALAIINKFRNKNKV